jgi:Ca2+-binding EF-hand superfamily protein
VPANDTSKAAAMTPATLAGVLEQLSVESRKKFGDLLAADWKQRPEWADMLIMLLKGEQMGPGLGWFKPSEKKYDWEWISDRFDANSDGKISPEELGVKDPGSDQFFARLDRDHDGFLTPADFDHFGRQQATPASMMSYYMTALFDTDSNGRITPEELAAFLKRADADKTGFITSEDLFHALARMFADRESGGSDMPRPERMLPMFFKGEFGVLESGPALGETAPEFTLPTHDGSRAVTLSQLRGKPVILIFGSFT